MIGIICAMQLEADGILALTEIEKTETIYSMKFTSGKMFGKDVVIVVGGEGKVNAAMSASVLIHKYQPDVVVNSGVAGSVCESLGIGDIVIAKNSVEHDMNITALGYKQGEVPDCGRRTTYFECDADVIKTLAEACKEIPDTRVEIGTVASGDIFISDRKKRLLIAERFGALVCEMEGAAIGHVCCRCGVPYGIIRAVSDDLYENEAVDYAKFCELASQKTVFAISRFVSSIKSA